MGLLLPLRLQIHFMPKAFISLLAILLSQFSFAQTNNAKISPEIKLSGKLTYKNIICADTSGFYALKVYEEGGRTYHQGDVQIEKWSLNQQQKTTINFGTKIDNGTYYNDLFATRHNFWFVHYADDKSKTTRKVYATICKIYEKNGAIIDTLLASIPIKGRNVKPTFYLPPNYGNFWIGVSQDSGKVLLCATPKAVENEPVPFYIKVMDEEGKVLLEKQVKSDVDEDLCTIMKCIVDKENNVYIVVKERFDGWDDTKGKGSNKKLNYDYTIYRIAAGSNEAKKYKITTIGNKIVDGNFMVSFNDKNDFVLTGLYYHSIDFKSCEGTVYYRMDVNGTIKDSVAEKFPESLFSSAGAIFTKDDNAVFPGGDLHTFASYTESDGSAMLACDYPANNVMAGARTWYFNFDITIIKFDADGKIMWVKSIPLNRKSVLASESVDQYFYKSGNLYNFIYSNSRENFNGATNGTIKNKVPCSEFGYGYLAERASVNCNTGDIKRSVLFDNSDKKIDEEILYDNSSHIKGTNGIVFSSVLITLTCKNRFISYIP